MGSEDEIKGAYKHALSNSPSKIVICGLYIEGTEFSVNGYLSEGKLIRLGVTDKIVGSFPHSIVIEVRCPSCISKKLQVDAYSLLEKASQAIGLTDGPIKADIIIDKKEKLFLLEVAPRFHGSLSSIHLIPEVTGITPFNEVLNLLEKKVYKEYDIDFTPNRSLFATAIDRKENCNPNGRILKWLEKPGITNREQWKSNYDTPLFAIWEKV